tara:strand:+ start:269 stop:472 length:204 start_codon:yes stop_codon:yes gene_type:complete
VFPTPFAQEVIYSLLVVDNLFSLPHAVGPRYGIQAVFVVKLTDNAKDTFGGFNQAPYSHCHYAGHHN